MGKGFGSAKKVEKEIPEIKTTRASMHKKVLGQYAKVLAQESNKFDVMRAQQCSIVDIYARLKDDEDCWFIGKIAYSGALEDAAVGHAVLLCEYAKSLRPRELAGPEALSRSLQLWFAVGDTEVSVAQNKLPLKPLLLHPTGEGVGEAETGAGTDTGADTGVGVAFQAEVYRDGEDGFRCQRDAYGQCVSEAFEVNFEDPSSSNFEDPSVLKIQ
jgi:hypothetical protein